MYKKGFSIVLSGILLGLSGLYFLPYVGWVAYVLLFWSLFETKLINGRYFTYGFFTGAIQGLIVLGWIPDLITRYTGSVGTLRVLIPLFLVVIFSIRMGLLILLFGYLKRGVLPKVSKFPASFFIQFTTASVILDFLFSLVFNDVPWLLHFIGYTQSANLYFSQLAELGGVWMLSFAVMLINLGLAWTLYTFNIRHFLAVLLSIGVILGYGFFRVKSIESKNYPEIKVALIADNSPPELRWNESNLNRYVQKLFSLNSKAIKSNPDLIIWNEGSVPWSYKSDDDFLKEILNQSKNNFPSHLMSYFSASTENSSKSFNSVYLIRSNGQVMDRYDKSLLLGGLEKPLFGIPFLKLPFFNTNVITGTSEGRVIRPLHSDHGNIGVVICNESLIDNITASIARKGASFFVVPANNGWFSNTRLIYQHLYVTRIRAIETRKDFVVNANLGFSGIIKASGAMDNINPYNISDVLVFSVALNPETSSFFWRKIAFFSIIIFLSLLLIFK